MNVSKELKLFRYKYKKYIKDVALELGVHEQSVINWEKGKPISDMNFFQLFELFEKYNFRPEDYLETYNKLISNNKKSKE